MPVSIRMPTGRIGAVVAEVDHHDDHQLVGDASHVGSALAVAA